MITVVCWKWNNGMHPKKKIFFTHEHVNKLRSAVEKNTTLKHNFVCICDDWKGLHSSVQPINIDRHFAEFKDWGGCYRRLRAFDLSVSAALFGSRFVSLDLDVLVTGNLDSILGFEEDFRIWQDKFRRKTPYCGSLWGMKVGARQVVWDSFRSKPHMSVELMRRLKYVGTDQAHISASLFPKEAVWGVDDGVYNFNTRVRRQVLYSHWLKDSGERIDKRVNGDIPEGAKLIFFNGKYDPSQVGLHRTYPWVGDLWNGF